MSRRRRAHAKLDRPHFTGVEVSHDEGRAKVVEAISHAEHMHVVVCATPGIGKTTAAQKYIAARAEPSEIAVPTDVLATQQVDAIAGMPQAPSVVAIRGRSAAVLDAAGKPLMLTGPTGEHTVERLCRKSEVAKFLGGKHLSVYKNLCGVPQKGSTCQYRADCEYLAQFSVEADVRVFNHHYVARRPGFLERRSLLVIDEGFVDKMTHAESIPLGILQALHNELKQEGHAWPYGYELGAGGTYGETLGVVVRVLVGQEGAILRKIREAGISGAQLIEAEAFAEERLTDEIDIRPAQRLDRQLDRARKYTSRGTEHVLLLLRALAAEMSAAPSRDEAHCAYYRRERDGQPVVRICWRDQIDRGKSPAGKKVVQRILCLDGSANRTTIAPFFRGADFEYHEIQVQRFGYVIQCRDRTCSRKALNDREAKEWVRKINKEQDDGAKARVTREAREALMRRDPATMSDGARAQQQIVTLIEREAANGRRVLVVASKAIRQQVELLRQWPVTVQFAHFNGQKGLNAWEDFDTGIVVGRDEPTLADIEEIARALWYDDPEPLRLLGPGHFFAREERGVRMRDGSCPAHIVSVHPDPRVQALVEQVREGGIIQAIDRLRGVNREHNPPRIIVLSSVVVDVTVDERASFDDITLGPPIVRAYIAAGGVLPLSEDYLRLRQSLSADQAKAGPRPPPGGWGPYRIGPPKTYRYRVGRQRNWSKAWVDSRLTEAEARDALARVLGCDLVAFEVINDAGAKEPIEALAAE